MDHKSKQDITTATDIEFMVQSFYQAVEEDELLAPIFNDFAKVDWDQHLPIMYRFWNSLILGTGTYKGNPFMKHIPLPVESQHFARWVQLFQKNIDVHFTGKNADQTKLRAQSIAHIFENKLAHIHS